MLARCFACVGAPRFLVIVYVGHVSVYVSSLLCISCSHKCPFVYFPFACHSFAGYDSSEFCLITHLCTKNWTWINKRYWILNHPVREKINAPTMSQRSFGRVHFMRLSDRCDQMR